MKRLLMLALGILFLLVGVAVGCFTFGYLADGAGLQYFRIFSNASILLGAI